MSEQLWDQVDRYLEEVLLDEDEVLKGALDASRHAGLPAINVSAVQGKFLQLLAQLMGARRILEVGSLGGYSAIWLGRALPPGGSLVSLELSPRHAEVAQANIARAGLSGSVQVRVGPALETLPQLAVEVGGPHFDLTFIDADKPNNAAYFAWALRLTRPGGVIIVDNVIRQGGVVDETSQDPGVVGARALFDAMAAAPNVVASAIQTVGAKGYDGFAIALVAGHPETA